MTLRFFAIFNSPPFRFQQTAWGTLYLKQGGTSSTIPPSGSDLGTLCRTWLNVRVLSVGPLSKCELKSDEEIGDSPVLCLPWGPHLRGTVPKMVLPQLPPIRDLRDMRIEFGRSAPQNGDCVDQEDLDVFKFPANAFLFAVILTSMRCGVWNCQKMRSGSRG